MVFSEPAAVSACTERNLGKSLPRLTQRRGGAEDAEEEGGEEEFLEKVAATTLENC